MVKLEAKKDGKGNIIITEDSFEHIMNCLANQKFVGEPPQCGDAMAMDPKEYKNVHEEIQAVINDCWKQGMDLLAEGRSVSAKVERPIEESEKSA